MTAQDNVSKKQFHMHLYHGTSTSALSGITSSGLGRDGAYLTSDPGLADYYADTAADQEGGDPVVLTVRANPRNLRVDHNAFEDPVRASEFDAQPRSFDPSKLRDADRDWKNSLRETGGVFHTGRITPENIVDVDHVYDRYPY